MKHHLFGSAQPEYSIAVLVKTSSFLPSDLKYYFVDELVKQGMKAKDIIAFDLEYTSLNKAPVKLIKAYLEGLLKALESLKVTTLLCADPNYFKTLTGVRKTTGCIGYIYPCKIEGYEHMSVILSPNQQSLFHDPTNQTNITYAVNTVANHVKGQHVNFGTNIIHGEFYPSTEAEIETALIALLDHPVLVLDLETFGLKFHECGIGTVGLAWDKHNGIAFACDWSNGNQIINEPVRRLLKKFLEIYKGKLIYHNSSFDIGILIYSLWMKDLNDQAGLLEGLEVMTRFFEDTKIIAFLALNSTAGNNLGLKELSHPYTGAYAEQNIDNIGSIPLPDLLKYCLTDTLATWYVYDKYKPLMVADKQNPVYRNIMLPSIKVILQMQLSGLPLKMSQVLLTEQELLKVKNKYLTYLSSSPLIASFEWIQQVEARDKHYQERFDKAKNPDKIKYNDIADFTDPYNPGSGKQTADLVYGYMGFEVTDTTDTGLPATGAKVLEKLVHRTQNQEYLDILDAIIELTKVNKILNTFIPAFKAAPVMGDINLLLGNFNLNGAKSGRMSSNSPNLMQIPSTGSIYAKPIKKCFKGDLNWILAGADFNSLESVVNALITRDPNKLKPLIEGIDSHSFNCFAYWPDQLPGIIDTKDSINSIKTDFSEMRQKSKEPSFLLQYGGKWFGLVSNVGMTEVDAKKVEANYHKLYKVSDDWTQAKLAIAAQTGYVDLAFGLRLRTPILKQTIAHTKSTPKEAEAEARTAGNALSGQSYSLLNNRAAIEFQERILKSKYKLDIKIVAMIHDSIYVMVRNNVNVVNWVNLNLIDCMSWQDLPELKHKIVKLGATLILHYPDWSHEISLPNKASVKEIKEICKEAMKAKEAH